MSTTLPVLLLFLGLFIGAILGWLLRNTAAIPRAPAMSIARYRNRNAGKRSLRL